MLIIIWAPTFVEEDEIVELIPDFSLGPLLLLGFAATPFLLRGGLRRLGVFLGRHIDNLKLQKNGGQGQTFQ